jgi:ABC-type Na+ efflux pump permease subunit
MEKIRTIISKEWSEVFKNRLVLFSVAFLPLIFIALPVLTVAATGSIDSGVTSNTGSDSMPGFEAICLGISDAECAEVYMLNLYAFMFMILPVAIPVTIAAYSIVGEKTTRSLEPLLATPITTTELLTGKALAAIIPAVTVTWLSFAIFLGFMAFMAGELSARSDVVSRSWGRRAVDDPDGC